MGATESIHIRPTGRATATSSSPGVCEP